MKALLLPLLLSVAAPFASIAVSEEFRTFTDIEGRRIQAVVIRANDSDVWIRREDGKDFRVPLDKFSLADRKYVEEWRQTDALKAPNALEFTAGRFTDGAEMSTSSSRKTTSEKYGYSVTLTNRSPIDLEDLMVEYRYFIRRGSAGVSGQDREVDYQDGIAHIDILPSRGKREFKTSTIDLQDVRLRPGWRFTNTNKRRFNDDLRGIRIRILQRGKLIAEFADPPKLLETERWE